ncbi:1-deoxy-D-xylulose-5-phosphate reductoisomerase [Spiroplasma cantharicola]|uniref:1-deoxy-D-xylulose 5-phosphate reductoisomerase n=1 Tax=Spiroplasma cantharicola TaxID=362837 RepID=A0A0M4JT31_9MOLU|nr:1-deoxy-D-xylulose-5-phosphate reductoisomerase [Spiroplasma cantharicola]ALD66646.1 1-deoxy-D-xylulose 5-phosphate reductoisomerase [Spiroplasma cantharicola]
MKNIVLFGASGSIGQQCIELLQESKDKFNLTALSVGENDSKIESFLLSFPTIKKVYSKKELNYLKLKYPNVEFLSDDILNILSKDDQIIINALSGFYGLQVTLKAIESNLVLLNANKESFVTAGNLINEMLKKSKTKIYPLDSEHCAIFQCLEKENIPKALFITASGGSFRNLTLEETKKVTLDQALKHPNWNMGQKITVDSSTMFNKAFEILEAYHLFGIKNIITLLHPQSIIHSMVGYNDGSIKAQLSIPDMKQVINYFLHYPKKNSYYKQKEIDFNDLIRLDLKEIDQKRFKPIAFALQCLELKNSKAIALNAANEVCVDYFLKKKINFFQITDIVEKIFQECENIELIDYEQIVNYDKIIRQLTIKRIEG